MLGGKMTRGSDAGMRKIAILITSLVLALCGPVVAYAANDPDVTRATVVVSASDACTVRLTGVSENTGGVVVESDVSGKGTMELDFDEPGHYEYELRQIASGGHAVYDETVYQVFVDVGYDNGRFVSVVTGGIKGTEDKPESFSFSKPKKETDKPKPSTPTKTSSVSQNVQTGDEPDISFKAGIAFLCLSGLFLFFWVMTKHRDSE